MLLDRLPMRASTLFHRFTKDSSDTYYKDLLSRNWEVKDSISLYQEEIYTAIEHKNEHLLRETEKEQYKDCLNLYARSTEAPDLLLVLQQKPLTFPKALTI